VARVAQIRPWIFEFFHAPGDPALDATPAAAAAHFAAYLDLWQDGRLRAVHRRLGLVLVSMGADRLPAPHISV
jgi:hypothetical protein